MSILVHNLSKYYGQQKALDEVCFDIPKGQIVGLLGPNGAGKSTLMRILTTFLAPSNGTATVCGFDICKQPLDVRKNIGYLPENNPLYTDMYVREYLQFIARLHLPSERIEEAVETTITETYLTDEAHKKIAQLSKGYRQRVGLAQAIIHQPEVIILDEPTSGLDPNQLIGIRDLIKGIGKEKTLILSTHIMQEVEQMCDRILLINKGKLVADKMVSEIDHLEQLFHQITTTE
ncbi:hypothetical protein FACS1894201_01140 [Bacteroidia bacterium]|nr:hypothetical protein FACS1894201_01140 [Bacteroidia bacterium]